ESLGTGDMILEPASTTWNGERSTQGLGLGVTLYPDPEEGADIVMVKPALFYLDVIYRARRRFDAPIAAYHVSGEYSMIKAAGKLSWLDTLRVELEALTAIKRAGADLIITYSALEVSEFLKGA
ncbi:MAG: hypothetical protein QW796_04475, partial [Thermoproteota archaeon]